MNLDEAKQAIDYYITNSASNSSLLALLAILTSLFAVGVSLFTFHKQRKEGLYSYLAKLYYDVLDDCMKTPIYLDVTMTENYYRLMSHEEALKYDAFCYKAWSQVEDIIEKKFNNNEEFEPIIRWVTAYHYTWLTRNPTFFTIEKFWEKINEIRETPNLIYGYRKLPSKDGDIDWNVVSENYYNYILSPFAPEMVKPDDKGRVRNKLLNYLNQIPADDIVKLEVADFGCGPGNLIPFIANRINKLTAIDISINALKIAESEARKYNIEFKSVCSDILNLDDHVKYDLIVSVNSILPKSRTDVVALLRKMRDCLKPSGKIIAILPSFDTTEYLKELWKDYYLKSTRNVKQVSRIEKAFEQSKKMVSSELSYADDGLNSQCYHTEASIGREFPKSGLKLVKNAEKIYYPWDLTRRFDYGYFPEAKEEIWDWFVIAERAELKTD